MSFNGGFDLVGMEARRRRADTFVTVLTRDVPWTNADIAALTRGINNSVCGKKNVLIIPDKREKATIAAILGFQGFELKVVQGMDNPELPFTPNFQP